MLQNKTNLKPADLDDKALTEFIIDMLHRMHVHETLWFREVEHQLGLERALSVMDIAWSKTKAICEKRYEKEFFGVFDQYMLTAGHTDSIDRLSKDDKLKLCTYIAKNWLAQDGVWFQAVENIYGMNDAKRCNDSTWARFSPFEAWSVKRFLELPDAPGLNGLETALNFRMYGMINIQSSRYIDDNTLIFEMNECRVQTARIRKGLADYPCKSAGLVEYSRFAECIDSRIVTECIGCPPDEHPCEWACSWKFVLNS